MRRPLCYNRPMLNIFYGNETCHKENFIFERINPDRKTIIIVPDQFSLQMERDALEYFKEKTGRTALLDLMVADFSSLGHKVVKEAGGKEPELIDKYGRHMLLSLLVDKLADKGELKVYENMKGRNSFTAHANQLISEMKRYGTTPEDIDKVTGETSSFLKLKLEDIRKIYGEYQEAIEGRFTDSEDYIRFYGDLMADSQLIKDAVIWVYGFDTFTPLNMEVLERILGACAEMNVVMTWEKEEPAADARILTTGGGQGLFDLTGRVINNLKDMAGRLSVPVTEKPMPEGTRSNIWKENFPAAVTLAETTNIYAEADRVAAHIMKLVREDGYRFGDIVVICNDMDVRGGALKRTFDRWNIPSFADRRRKVLHQPVVRFLLSYIDVIAAGYEGDAIMEMVSAGLMGWSGEDEELLTNYVEEGKIRGTKWKKEFTWAGRESRGSRYTDEELQRLNEMRQEIVRVTEGAREEIGKRNTAGEKITGLYSFLENDFEIRDRIAQLIERQQELNLAEGAAETAQSWNMICGIFAQVIRVIGEERISNVKLRDILEAGLKEMEIGLVPVSTDCVIIGTLQRTRISKTRSLIVMAANEGILPMQSSEGGLLTDRELEILEDLKLSISKRDEVRRQEEQLAIYRTFSLPSEDLFVTCSLADQEGKSSLPSGIFSVLKETAGVKCLGDLGSEDIMEKFPSREGTVTYMATAIQEFIENGKIDDRWLAAMNWYEDNAGENMNKIRQGLVFDNKINALGRDLADSLYFGDKEDIHVSASRLELYSKCPFKHFIQYGLKADESRGFEIDGRTRGDVYHEALMTLSRRLTDPGTPVTHENSPWMTITEEECREQIKEILTEETAGYREGVYVSTKENQLQVQRIIETCGDIAWAMIGQVRKGNTSRMFFEESFGYYGNVLKPIEIELQDGKKALLAGRIDRIDVIDVPGIEGGEDSEVVRVIDYKTGGDTFNREQVESGYKLQLMLYMNAAEGVSQGDSAGVFYFKIDDTSSNSDDGKAEKIPAEERIAKSCRLEGVLVDDRSVLKAMDGSLAPGETSTVIPVKIKKDGGLVKYNPSELLPKEEFDRLKEIALEQAERICREIQEGRIDVEPKVEKSSKSGNRNATSCDYCSYKGICMFDTSFRQCRYTPV